MAQRKKTPGTTVSQIADALQVLLEQKARGIMTRPQLRQLADQLAAEVEQTEERNRRAQRSHRKQRLRELHKRGIKISKLPFCDAKVAL